MQNLSRLCFSPLDAVFSWLSAGLFVLLVATRQLSIYFTILLLSNIVVIQLVAGLVYTIRGKVSEGIDFRDHKGRVVIITGLCFSHKYFNLVGYLQFA